MRGNNFGKREVSRIFTLTLHILILPGQFARVHLPCHSYSLAHNDDDDAASRKIAPDKLRFSFISSSFLRSASFYIYPAVVAIVSPHYTTLSFFLPSSNETNLSEVPHPLHSIIPTLSPPTYHTKLVIRQFLSISITSSRSRCMYVHF